MRNRTRNRLAALLPAIVAAASALPSTAAAPAVLAGHPWVGGAPAAVTTDGYPWIGSSPAAVTTDGHPWAGTVLADGNPWIGVARPAP
jgi:hypothetical protein